MESVTLSLMPVETLISVAEYLSTTYRPDCEYLEGTLLERNLGEYPHSYLQMMLGAALLAYKKQCDVMPLPEQRIQVSKGRYRIPDLCLVSGKVTGPILTEPPLLCVEILSKADRMSEMQERIDDYLSFGVPCVWILDPLRRIVYSADRNVLKECRDGVLRLAEPPIAIEVELLWPPRG